MLLSGTKRASRLHRSRAAGKETIKTRKRQQQPPRQRVEPASERLRSEGPNDPIEVELGEDRNHPGYYADEATDPLPSSIRPNKGGCMFILFGVLGLFGTLLAVTSGAMPWFFGILAAIPVLLIAVGYKIMKGG